MQRGVQRLRCDAIAVWYRVRGSRAPAATIGAQIDALHHRREIVARADHQRHPQRKFIAGLMHRLLIFDLHQNGFAGADIGDRIGEHVRPLLLGQRRLAAAGAGLLVNGASLLPLLDIADDDAIADHHLQGIDRAAFRQRIDVSRLDPIGGRIAKDLRDPGSDRWARHREVDIDAEPGRVGVTVVGLQEQRARTRIAGMRDGGRCLLRPHRLEADEQRDESDQDHRDALHQDEQQQFCQARQIGRPVGFDLVAGGHFAHSEGDVFVTRSCAERSVVARAD